MRYMVKNESSADRLLDQLAQAAYQVVEGNIPASSAEDVRMGFYVAFHQVLADNLAKIQECGTLPGCEDLREEHPFTGAHAFPARGRA